MGADVFRIVGLFRRSALLKADASFDFFEIAIGSRIMAVAKGPVVSASELLVFGRVQCPIFMFAEPLLALSVANVKISFERVRLHRRGRCMPNLLLFTFKLHLHGSCG